MHCGTAKRKTTVRGCRIRAQWWPFTKSWNHRLRGGRGGAVAGIGNEDSGRPSSKSSASFLGLIRELRDCIYALALPFGNIHISYDANGYEGSSSYEGLRFHKGRDLARQLCVSEEDDHVEGREWIENGSRVYVSPYEAQHTGCLYQGLYKQTPESTWPFALLFVCRHAFGELYPTLYMRYSFALRGRKALDAFATNVLRERVAQVSDLRLWLRMVSSSNEASHISVDVVRRFTRLRKLHASLDCRFFDIRHMRDSARTEWEWGYRAQGLRTLAAIFERSHGHAR